MDKGVTTMSADATDPIITSAKKLNGAAPPRFNLAELRVNADTDNSIGVAKLLTKVPVRRPDRQQFFRAHPDEAYCDKVYLFEAREDRTTYLVHPRVAAGFPGDVRQCYLATAIDRAGVVFLIPVKIPPDDRSDDWAESLFTGIHQARTRWTKIASNRDLGAYEISIATATIPEPTWPEKSYEDLLNIAFQGRYIDSPDHPVLLRLEGRL